MPKGFKFILSLLLPVLLFGQDTILNPSKSKTSANKYSNNLLSPDSIENHQLTITDLQTLFKKQDSVFQINLGNLERRLVEKQKLLNDSSEKKIFNFLKVNSQKLDAVSSEIKYFIKNDSITTQKLRETFLEKSKSDEVFFKQISASGKILSEKDSIFIIRLDSSVTYNLNEASHILNILKGESKFLDTYTNLSLFALGLIGGNLLNGHEAWGFYLAEVVGAMLAWASISRKHAIDDDIDDFQHINDDLNNLKKSIKNFRLNMILHNYKYPSFLSEKIPLVDKKYDLLSHNIDLDNIFGGADLKRDTKRYRLLIKSHNWIDMFIISGWHSIFPYHTKKRKN